MKPVAFAVTATMLGLCVTLSLSKGPPAIALAESTPSPALLVATSTFLMYVEGDRRQPAVAGPSAGAYRAVGSAADGSAYVSFDDGAFTNVETISPALTTRTVKTFPRGTAIFRADDGFLAFDASSQLVRRYDGRGSLVGAPVVGLGMAEALGVGDTIVTLGGGRLRVFERNGRERKEINLEGNALTPLPGARFALNDVRDGEVRAYTTALEQTATLKYVGLPVRALASSPDGALAVLAGTPACVTSNAEIDVFTDLHAQPAARIHGGVTSTNALAISADAVYAVNAPCRSDEDGSINVYARDGTARGTLRSVGIPISIQPFRRAS
ncbi:MAG TPA: hypothetical protein VGC96_03260 [Candidatus Elarobacter sp.]